MSQLTWWSQRFAAEGAVAADGIVKQLGTPALDPLTVLVREAAQNSWDARAGTTPVDFSLHLQRLGERAAAWRRHLLPAPDAESLPGLLPSLDEDQLVLTISDRGTVGLGGPVRADVRVPDGVQADFVQFLRNVGEPSDHAFGGGTYGFGKGSLYRVSNARTIVVDTTTAAGGLGARRLIGSALGHSWYGNDGRRYTGRHWWGRPDPIDGVLDPALDDEAASIAADLGLPGFDDGRTGTDIVMLGFDPGVAEDGSLTLRTPADAMSFLVSSILWHLWPKFSASTDGSCHMRFHAHLEGRDLEIPDPSALPVLGNFVAALEKVRSGDANRYARTRPPRNAGHFAFDIGPAAHETERLVVGAARPFSGPSHHVARMRTAELVVDYFEGPLHPNPSLSYGAVFRASEEADHLFAAAEPPTHDDWNEKGLGGTAKGVVQGARTFIRTQLDVRLGTSVPARGEASEGLGALSARLSGLIPTTNSIGAGPTSGSGGGAGPKQIRARLVGPPRLLLLEGAPYIVGTVSVPPKATARTVHADAFVVLEGGARETERPEGAPTPEILQWLNKETREIVLGDTLRMAAQVGGEFLLYASHVEDAVIRLAVRESVAPGGE